MFIDSRRLPTGEVISTDVCIVGAGPAGIALAKEFVAKKFRVCLLEGGDMEFNEEAAALGEGETVGDPFQPIREMRYRQFGGMANLWNVQLYKGRVGVRYVDFDAIDFEKRDWIPYSGWPITKADLLPFYKRAHEFCHLGPYDYSTRPWESEDTPKLPFKNDRVESSMFKFGPSDIFTKDYKDLIDKSGNITTYTNANVVEVESDETAKTVKRVHAACLTGNKFTVEAKTFVLCAGGMENARILLLSDRVEKNGMGNQHDVVGRYFMDHPLLHSGLVIPTNRNVFNSMGLYDKRRVNNETVMGKVTLTEAVMRREKLMHMSAMFFPRDEKFKSYAHASAKALFHSLKHGKIPKDTVKHIQNVARHPDWLVTEWYRYNVKKELIQPNLSLGEWSLEKENDKRYAKFELISQTEQAPHPDNRVTLSPDRDKLGCRKVRLTNYWNDIDKASVEKSQQIFAEEFFQAGLGKTEKVLSNGKPEIYLSTHHNMGITRMHEDVKQGVVDADCKVHGISNLFIAGSSVFPTGGYANPTLTIVALAFRLADHINAMMQE